MATSNADHTAAVIYLRYLKLKHPQQEDWPISTPDFIESIFGVRAVSPKVKISQAIVQTTGSVALQTWAKKHKNDAREIWKRLQTSLVAINALNVKSGGIRVWNHQRIQSILEDPNENNHENTLPTSDSANDSTTTPVQQSVPKVMHHFIQTHDQMQQLQQEHPSLFSSNPFDILNVFVDDYTKDESGTIFINCKGTADKLYLIGVSNVSTTWIFDCVALGEEAVCSFLSDLLSEDSSNKILHDSRFAAAALARHGIKISPVFDTQLAIEAISSKFDNALEDAASLVEEHGAVAPLVEANKSDITKAGRIVDPDQYSTRPLQADLLLKIVAEIKLTLQIFNAAMPNIRTIYNVINASSMRVDYAIQTGGLRQVGFDSANGYRLCSFELVHAERPDDLVSHKPLLISNDTSPLLDLLQSDLASGLQDVTDKVSDIVLDKGRPPSAWVDGKRVMLGNSNDRLVTSEEINLIVDELGGFGTDNRAGLEKHLHRISAIRNRENAITGLTLRVGRHISGNATMIIDLLFGHPQDETPPSILFLGEPGSGKTTIIREVTRLLAEQNNVCIVDTSNEIAGDGDVPHSCVGLARRMMVPSLDKQGAVMIECVQNHTPHVMVIDEIGRSIEVDAASTCKNRGVRLLASAHGDLRKLVKNSKLRGLVGGLQNVILGDAQAKLEGKKAGANPSGSLSKMKAERAGAPIFDIIVELKRHEHDEWRVILNSGEAVDMILSRQAYEVQRRIRDPKLGTIHIDFEMN